MPHRPETLDPDIRDAIYGVLDPEVGVSLVDLGLVYRARREDGRIEVAISLTTPACPLGDMLAEEVRECLERRFGPGLRADVAITWDPPWDPSFITDRGRVLLGLAESA